MLANRLTRRMTGREMNMADDPATLRAQQEVICARYGLHAVEPEDRVAVAISTLGRMPVYGTRISLSEGENVSWFFHCGEYADAVDFYQPLHAAHLSTYLPLVLPYLRLPAGTRFIIDDAGYEDVWIE
ncbi:immunity protein Imm33 domain-containing protein [Burkholderia arboris]|uniref:immunity protein Imm33 domain-containing protein n=1 Tax=Burkholderia arboris TaxID=488730 RepID=UPI0030F350DC